MKATSGLWQKLDNNKIQKAEQPSTISMINGTAEQSSALDGKKVSLYVCHIHFHSIGMCKMQ
jgi:hypothetical protein